MSTMKIIFFACLIVGQPLLATQQVPDRIRIQGIEYSLLSFPSIQAPGIENVPKFTGSSSSANWRQYIATWEISENQLWLTNVEATLLVRPASVEEIRDLYNRMRRPGDSPYDPNKKYAVQAIILNGEPARHAPATLDRLFPGLVENGRVFAFWFTGELEVGQDGHSFKTKEGSGFGYKRKIIYTVTKGIISKKQLIENPTPEWEYRN